MKLIIEVVGWIGATLIISAYALLSAGKLQGDSRTYHLMNIFGAMGFVVNSGWNGAYPSAALNVVWIFIGAYALLPGSRAARTFTDRARDQRRACRDRRASGANWRQTASNFNQSPRLSGSGSRPVPG
jgi:hypothetical protein